MSATTAHGHWCTSITILYHTIPYRTMTHHHAMHVLQHNCTRPGEYAGLASFNVVGSDHSSVLYLAAWGLPYPFVLTLLMFLMGLGKGGVPGSSTSAVALTALLAPHGPRCLQSAVALCVPVTWACDVFVARTYLQQARLDLIQQLLPPACVGLFIGMQLLGSPWLTDSRSMLLVGFVLLLILVVSLFQAMLVPQKPSAVPPGGKLAAIPQTGGLLSTGLDGVPLYVCSLITYPALIARRCALV